MRSQEKAAQFAVNAEKNEIKFFLAKRRSSLLEVICLAGNKQSNDETEQSQYRTEDLDNEDLHESEKNVSQHDSEG